MISAAWNRSAFLLRLALLHFAVSYPANAEPSYVTREQVKASFEEDGAAWSAKIKTLGRPRLLLDRTGLAEIRARLMANPLSPEVRTLLARAYEVASLPPRPYASPEERVKMDRTTPFDASAELWIRGVGDDITMLAVAAALDPSPVLLKSLHDTVIETCRYPTWGAKGAAAPANMDLSCAHAARGIALAWDWFPDLWTTEDRTLIRTTISERIGRLLSGLYGKAFWAKGYADNHNQVNCTALGWCGIAFYEDIGQAPEWLTAARLNFQNVAKAYPEDGSSAEGVPYWSYGMGFILQYIEGTRNVIDSANLYRESFLKSASTYRLNTSTSGLGGCLPWGDATKRDFYGPQHILNRLATEYDDSNAAWLSRHIPWQPEGGADVLAFAALWQPIRSSRQVTLPLDYHHWVTDMVTTRSGWGPGDYLLAIKSGFTNRNHSHLDAGSLALAFGTDWLLTAPGYGKGGRSPGFWDFQGERWNYFSNATESHCTLLIDGQNQRFDHEARGTIDSFFTAPLWCFTSIDLTQAYKNMQRVQRDILHRRGDYVLVFDSVTPNLPPPAAEGAPTPNPSVTVEWLAQLADDPETRNNTLTLKSESGQLRIEMLLPAQAFVPRQPRSLHIDIDDSSQNRGIHTFAIKNSGDAVRFIALLQPSFGKEPAVPLKAKVTELQSGTSHVEIMSGAWTDHVLKASSTDPVTLALEGVKATALVLAFRKEGNQVTSCIATQATAVEIPGLAITSTAPADVGFQKIRDGSWLVDSSQDLAGKIVAKGFTIHPMEKTGNAFRYLLATKDTTPAQAEEWLASILVFRERAPVTIRPLPAQPPLTAAATIPIEAEDFSGQYWGRAEIVEGKPGSIGNSVRGFGNGAPDHTMKWIFEVPQGGQYELVIRYASNLPEVHAAVLIDGAAPAEDMTKLSFISTGGWSIKEDNWKDWGVTDRKGKPFLFNLSAGKHRLQLVKPDGALALDRLEFRGAGQ